MSDPNNNLSSPISTENNPITKIKSKTDQLSCPDSKNHTIRLEQKMLLTQSSTFSNNTQPSPGKNDSLKKMKSVSFSGDINDSELKRSKFSTDSANLPGHIEKKLFMPQIEECNLDDTLRNSS